MILLIYRKKMDDIKNDTWDSCCLRIDKHATKFFIQTGVLVGVIIMSSAMLIISKDCESQRNYASLLTLTLGVFLPAPRMGE